MVTADDPQVAALRESGAPVVTLVAKSHDRHVTAALRTTPAENLAMIADTVRHLSAEGQRVFLDAEHFFDGYRSDPAYALEVVRVAAEAGAEVVALCDTNGGMLPAELGDVVTAVASATGARLGIHCHDDTACAVANTLTAVAAGVSHVQGTANGYGERANANLFSVVAGLQLKQGRQVLPDGCLAEMSRVAHAISEVTNVTPLAHQPNVGFSAFAHKAGLHASAVKVDPMLYQHVDPALVGNDMRMLVSDMAGRASVEIKGRQLGYDLSGGKPGSAGRVVERVKDLEARGYTFEAADASFELLLRDELAGERLRHFQVESWRVIVERRADAAVASEATVKLTAKGERIVATGEGNGPVNALDNALRLALERLYPELAMLELADYKVRILENSHGTGAVTRVLIESGMAPARRTAPGARWAWTRTSSPHPGTRWKKPSPMPCCGLATSPARQPPDAAELGQRYGGAYGRQGDLGPHRRSHPDRARAAHQARVR